MPQFTAITFTNGAVIDADDLNTIFAAIEAAFNTHETGDFPNDSVPLSALATDKQYYALNMEIGAAVGVGVVIGTIQDNVVVPFAAKLIGVRVVAKTIAGGADPTVDVYDEGAGPAATVLTGVVTIAAANTAYAGTINGTQTFAAGDIITQRCTTNAGDGELAKCRVTLLFELDLQA